MVINSASVQDKVLSACNETGLKDGQLFGGVSEWAVAHRLAIYLEKHFPGYSVDCEYNRMPGEPEATYDTTQHVPKRLHGNKQVRPDIIIHERGNNDRNLVVIELKKASNKHGIDDDAEKLRAFKDDASLRYAYAFQVTIPIGKDTQLGLTPI